MLVKFGLTIPKRLEKIDRKPEGGFFDSHCTCIQLTAGGIDVIASAINVSVQHHSGAWKAEDRHKGSRLGGLTKEKEARKSSPTYVTLNLVKAVSLHATGRCSLSLEASRITEITMFLENADPACSLGLTTPIFLSRLKKLYSIKASFSIAFFAVFCTVFIQGVRAQAYSHIKKRIGGGGAWNEWYNTKYCLFLHICVFLNCNTYKNTMKLLQYLENDCTAA